MCAVHRCPVHRHGLSLGTCSSDQEGRRLPIWSPGRPDGFLRLDFECTRDTDRLRTERCSSPLLPTPSSMAMASLEHQRPA